MGRRAKPTGNDCPYVSKGGLKLEFALKYFRLSVENLIAGDLGSHQGGFVDCLLQANVNKVYSIDTCYGTLAWTLRQNPRVIVYERTNALHWRSPEKLDFISIDVGWTRMQKILPIAADHLKNQGVVLVLLKPQYQLEYKKTRKGVLSVEQVKQVVDDLLPWLRQVFTEVQLVDSPLLGSGGNREVWLYLQQPIRKI